MEDVKLQEKIKAFLSVDHGYGDGDGSGSGSGSGYGYGYGDGYGYGSGDGDGSGYGSDSGYGYGYGYGSGSGSGYGDGDGSGYVLEAFCRKPVCRIDDTPTILTSVHNNVAKGFILMSDFSLRPCFVVKGNRMFAHGETLRDAMDALTAKMFEYMPEEERIAEFIKAHPEKDKAYPNQDLFDWHNRLTGSCEMGRKTFIQDKGLSLDGESTVTFFIELTKNAYNGSVIRNLEAAYNQ